MDVPRRVDDPVPAAEQAAISDPLQDLGDFGAVLGVLVGEQQFGRGLDGAGFVAVHARDLVGPLPALSDEPESECPCRELTRRRTQPR